MKYFLIIALAYTVPFALALAYLLGVFAKEKKRMKYLLILALAYSAPLALGWIYLGIRTLRLHVHEYIAFRVAVKEEINYIIDEIEAYDSRP